MNPGSATVIAFEGDRRIAAGDIRVMSPARQRRRLSGTRMRRSWCSMAAPASPIDIDFRGSIEDVLARLPETAGAPAADEDSTLSTPRGPGRPKLGVVAREITLLPRHWEWLAQQSGGASVAIRKLVEQARRSGEDKDRIRQAQEAAYRFMSAMAGNRPHYEDAIRALFADDSTGFEKLIAGWPADVREHALAVSRNGAFRRETQPRAG